MRVTSSRHLLAVPLLLLPISARAEDWPQWRGPNRDNVSTETDLAKQWPEDGPPLRWRVQGLGLGISTVSIADGRVFTLSQYQTNEYVRALDEQSGESLWSTLLGEAPPQGLMMRWLTQRPPTIDGERLYATSLFGDLLCLQAADGKELWRRNYAAEFAGQLGLFGYSDCPIVCDDKLLCTPGGAEASILALDKVNGEVIWKCPVANGGKAAYANGVVAKIAGQAQFVTFVEKALVGVAVEDGKLLWRVDGVADVGFHPHTPLIHGNTIACINAFGQGGIRRLELERKDSAWSVKEAYAIKSSHLAQYQDDTVLREDRLYEFHRGVASCFDFATGQVLWQQRLGGTAAMTWADGRFYLYNPGQAIDLVEPQKEGPVVMASCSLPEAGDRNGASTPVIAGGCLYVRMDDELFCYDVRQEAMGRSPAAARLIELLPLHIGATQQAGRPRVGVNRAPDAVFVPTPQDMIEQMLKLARVEKRDVVYDLGSGDGRIVIAAAKTYGVKAVGVEIDPELIKLSQQRVQESNLADLVTIRHEDMFQVDLSQADVVAVFLFPRLLERLKPQFAKMKPGSRIVSHQFLMPDVEPDQVITLESTESGDRHTLYLWTTPLKTAPPKPE